MKPNIVVAVLLMLFFACDSGDKSAAVEDPKGNLQIGSSPSGALIYLDNLNSGQMTPFTFTDLDTGLHEIRLSKAGYFDDSILVRVEDGSTATSSRTLTPLSTPVSMVFLSSSPSGASIFLDGNPTGKLTPDTLKSVTVGEHQLKLTLSGYADSVFSVSVAEGVLTNKAITLRALPFGNVFVSSSPSGAAIHLDNVSTGKITPDTLKNIASGNHSVKLTLANYVDSTFAVSVPEAGQTVNFSVQMRPVPSGNLFITSSPAGASIFLNGNSTGKLTPDTLKNVAVGSPTLKLTLSGYFDSTFSASVVANQTSSYNITMSKILKVPVVVQNIFNNHCTGCHSGPGSPHGQDLSESVAYYKIVNMASAEQPALKRIAPGDTTNSYLIRKIQGTAGISGARMPFGGPYLSTAQIDSIRSWVFNGALPR